MQKTKLKSCHVLVKQSQKNKRIKDKKKNKTVPRVIFGKMVKRCFFFFFCRDRDQIDLHSYMNLIQLETLHVGGCI